MYSSLMSVLDSCPSLSSASSGLSSLCVWHSALLRTLLSPFAAKISPIPGNSISESLSALF